MSTLKVDTVQSTGGSTIFTHSSGLFKPNAVLCQVSSLNTDQSVSAATETKVQWGTVDIDTGGFWNTSNHAFEPTIAGWYLFGGTIRGDFSNVMTYVRIRVRRDGSSTDAIVSQIQTNADSLTNGNYAIPTATIHLNGSQTLNVSMDSEEACTLHDTGAPYYSKFFVTLVHAT